MLPEDEAEEAEAEEAEAEEKEAVRYVTNMARITIAALEKREAQHLRRREAVSTTAKLLRKVVRPT